MVDDARDVGAFVQRVAESIGYDMEFADRAAGFESRYRSFHPDVVILDLAIPDADGIELLSFLAREGSGAQILLMSGLDEAVRDSALRLGDARGLRMAGIVPKPVRAGELRSILTNLSGRQGVSPPCRAAPRVPPRGRLPISAVPAGHRTRRA